MTETQERTNYHHFHVADELLGQRKPRGNQDEISDFTLSQDIVRPENEELKA